MPAGEKEKQITRNKVKKAIFFERDGRWWSNVEKAEERKAGKKLPRMGEREWTIEKKERRKPCKKRSQVMGSDH